MITNNPYNTVYPTLTSGVVQAAALPRGTWQQLIDNNRNSSTHSLAKAPCKRASSDLVLAFFSPLSSLLDLALVCEEWNGSEGAPDDIQRRLNLEGEEEKEEDDDEVAVVADVVGVTRTSALRSSSACPIAVATRADSRGLPAKELSSRPTPRVEVGPGVGSGLMKRSAVKRGWVAHRHTLLLTLLLLLLMLLFSNDGCRYIIIPLCSHRCCITIITMIVITSSRNDADSDSSISSIRAPYCGDPW